MTIERLEGRELLASDLVLSEFVAAGSLLRDVDGDTSDWIEIHNPTDQPVSLLGWSLTDDAGDLGKWKLPLVHIAPGGYQVVFASDKNRADDSAFLTRDFNAIKDGTFVIDLDEATYDIRLTIADTERARDEMVLSIQGQQVDVLGTDAGTTLVRTYRAEVGPADGGQLVIRLEDRGGVTGNAVINALVITPVTAGTPRWFDFGPMNSPVEPGFVGVSAADTYNPATGYGWLTSAGLSAQDRGAAPYELHANFKLDGEGEFLALVQPDESTIAFAYAPHYPPQQLRTSYGVEQLGTEATPITAGAEARVLVPTVDNGGLALATAWTEMAFDDSAWIRAATGVGYERGSEAVNLADLIATDIGAEMFGVNATAYLRIPFTIAQLEKVFSLLLRMKYDDGYVAYLNGTQVASANAPSSLQPDADAERFRDDARAREFEDVDISPYIGLLRTGTNVLAVHALNGTADDQDVLILPELLVRQSAAIESTTPRHFTTPTPGAPNGTLSFGGLTPAPRVSVTGGLFEEPFAVQVTTNAPGATLVVTTDGSAPTRDNGVQMTAASTTVHVSGTTVLRAAAFQEDFMLSPATNRTYIFPADVAAQDDQATRDAGFPVRWGPLTPDYGLDPDVVGPADKFNGVFAEQFADALRAIPTLSIVMDLDELFGPDGIYTNAEEHGHAWERPTSIEWLDPAGGPGFQVDAGIRIYGGFTREDDVTKKKSFRLVFRSQYGPTTLAFPLFGQDATDQLDTIVLRCNGDDGWQYAAAGPQPQYIRDEWMRVTQLAMQQPSAHGTFAHVYINGIYWGLYNPVERPDASFSATYSGGDKDDWDGINVGSVINGTGDAWDAVRTLAADVYTTDQQASNAAYQLLLGNRPDGTDDPDLETLLDVDNMIDYMIANFYGGNTDWPNHNFYVGRLRGPESTGFKFYSWDAEWTLNLRSDVTVNVLRSAAGPAVIFQAIRHGNAEFRLRFADHVHKHFFNGGALYVDSDHPEWDPEHPEWNVPAARYAALADGIELPLIAESARWGDQHRTELPYTLNEWRAERDFVLETYFPQRSAIVLEQFKAAGLYPNVAAPAFSQHGGEVVAGFELRMTGPGAIYYTLDGSDPRRDSFSAEPGVSARAVPYSGPVRLGEGAVVKARALVNGEWSALNEAHFTVGAPPLRITEVMYHPHDAGAGSPYADENDFEFIELVNTSAVASIDLEDVALTQGIEFAFPPMVLAPGQHVVVVRNQAAFAWRYGEGILIAGQYGGTASDMKLSNSGETVRLEDATGALIQEFTYDDAWFGQTDGGGFSLEVLDPARTDLHRLNQADAWLPSIALGGTPGAARSTAPVLAGDANLDGQIDASDVGPFALGLAAPEIYQQRFGVPAALPGDVDGDGDLDFDDIDDFVLQRRGGPAVVTGAGSPASCSLASWLVQTAALSPVTAEARSSLPDAVATTDRVSRRAAARVCPGVGPAEACDRRVGRALCRREGQRSNRPAARGAHPPRQELSWNAMADLALASSGDWLA